MGLTSALGNLQTTWASLLAGKTGIQHHQPFLDLPPLPLGMVGMAPLGLETLTLQTLGDLLEDGGLTPPLGDCGVVIGSSRGQQALLERWARGEIPSPSPGEWWRVLPQTAALTVAQQLGTTGPVLAPMAACATGLWAIAQGYELIQTGQCQRVIAGACEAPITPLTLAGFERMGALATTGAYPFDRDREGLVLGEGAALFLLETPTAAASHPGKIYGQISGVGLTADGYHVSAPAPYSQGAIAAVEHCLARSHWSPATIDYFHAHGTGTRLNDRQEAHLFQTLFPHRPPLSSSKGATGHTLGASGALGAALCCQALVHQVVPPSVGLRIPEIADLPLVRQALSTPLERILCCSFGFGGQNAILALAKPP